MRRILSLVTVIFTLLAPTFAVSADEADFFEFHITEDELLALSEAVEACAGDSSFALRVALASVALNRRESALFPSTLRRVIECSGFLKPSPGISVSPKTLEAVRYALYGAAPAGNALYASPGSSIPDGKAGILIDGWCFWS